MPELIYTEKKFGFDMIFVEGGDFIMGSQDERANSREKPAHRVELAGFYIGKYLVTQDLWEAVMGAGNNPSTFKGKNRPVEQVSWYDAAVFCNALNEQCNYDSCYFKDKAYRQPYGKTASGYELPNEGEVFLKPNTEGYRLPTEAEWEYAARGGVQVRMDAARGGPHAEGRPRYEYVGGEKLDELGWYAENSHGETKPVGLKLPNELGIYDMSGNVWEWCEDQWHGNYESAPNDGSAWVDQEAGAYRVFRGGSWFDVGGNCRCAYRSYWHPQFRFVNLGFRLVWFSPSVHPVK